MSELFTPLRECESVPALPPEEVRRRGDRLRRRRAGLQVLAAGCVVAVVLAGGSLVAGGPSSSSSPGPADSTGPFPAELDLADGLPRQPMSSEVPELIVCGVPYPRDDLAVASEGVSGGERGDLTARTLTVYQNADAARAAATELAARFRSCPRYTDHRGREVVTSVRASGAGDRGWVVEQQWTAPGPGVDFPQVIEVVQVDASLLVVEQREVHGLRLQVLGVGTSRQVEWLLDHQVCLVTAAGCTWRSDPDVLRPDGWGRLRLGMTREEVEAAGFDRFSDAGACTAVDMRPGTGLLSDEDRLVGLQVPEGVTTADGIGVGSSADDVFDTYWFQEPTDDGVLQLRASPDADFVITLERDRVAELALFTVDAACVTPDGGGSRR